MAVPPGHDRRVGEAAWAKAAEGWRFRTTPLDLNRPVRVVTGGDTMHTRQKPDKATANAAALDPDFAPPVGELAYANGVSSNRWVEWLTPWTKEVKGGYNGKMPEGGNADGSGAGDGLVAGNGGGAERRHFARWT